MLEAVKTKTQNGPPCIKRGTKWCRSTLITSIPWTKILVLEFWSCTWFLNIAVAYSYYGNITHM